MISPLLLSTITFMVLTIIIQILCIELGGQALKAVPLTPTEHLICIGLGMSSIFMGVIFKLLIPASLFTFLVRETKKEAETPKTEL